MFPRKSLAPALALLLCCGHAQAWYFDEHRHLGEAAFLNACTELERALAETATQENSAAAEARTGSLQLLRALPCRNVPADAASYGIWSALAGDHISSPDHFLDVKGELEALSWENYGTLALRNHEHFWPDVKKTWQRHHLLALEQARQARAQWLAGRSLEAAVTLKKAIVYSAYADHFLQDAFSIGHMGFSRVNSQQNASLNFHDFWNENGRWLRGMSVPGAARAILISREQRVEELARWKDRGCTALERPRDAGGPGASGRSATDGQAHCAASPGTALAQLARLPVNPPGEACRSVAWYAFGDQSLCVPENLYNKKHIVEANTAAITAVLMAFILDEDTGYSLVAENSFPVESQVIKTSTYSALPNVDDVKAMLSRQQDAADPAWLVSSQSHVRGRCSDEALLASHDRCWFNIESAYMEPAYPQFEVLATLSHFPDLGASFWGARVSYGFYTEWVSRLLSRDDADAGFAAKAARKFIGTVIPPNSRPYIGISLQPLDTVYDGNGVQRYAEIGINYSLPNLYEGTAFSHDIDIAMGQFGEDSTPLEDMEEDVERGLYLGFNTNADLKKAKVTLSVGSLFPHANTDSAELKVQASIGWAFGTIGGGPITRWSDQ